MSTNNENQVSTPLPEAGSWATVLPTGGAVPPSPLDATELARLATEFFTALPEPVQTQLSVAPAPPLRPGSPADVNPHAGVPQATPPAFPGVLGGMNEAHPGNYFFAPDRNTVPDRFDTHSFRPPAPETAAPIDEADPFPLPVFSFLHDARPLNPEAPAELAVGSAPTQALVAPPLPGGGAIPASPLDPAELARMANELFNPQPESKQPPLSVAPAPPVRPGSPVDANPQAVTPPPVSSPGAPGAVSAQAGAPQPVAPALPGSPVDVNSQATAQQPTTPAFPGAPGGLNEAQPGNYGLPPDRNTVPDRYASSSLRPPSPETNAPVDEGSPLPLPAFSFLQDARPISPPAPAELPAGNTPAQAAGTAVPTDAGFAAIPASLPNAVVQLRDESPQPPTPAPPGALRQVDSSATPAFSFVEEARPLSTIPPNVPGSTLPASSGAESRNNPFAAPLDASAPQLPGTVAHTPDYRAASAQNTAEPPRSLQPVSPLQSVSVAPVVVPAGGERDVPGELKLSSYSFDVEAIRRDFPILRERVNGFPLVWFDNAATTQKPQQVIDRLSYFYQHENSNVHRAAHELAARATDAYESAREKTRRFLNAGSTREIVFVRGATEAINLVAQSWGRRNVQKDDEIVITWLEHHANIVPWQMLCAEKGAHLKVAPVDDSGQVLLDEYEKLLGPRTRLVAITQVSNALGTVTPVEAMVQAAHRHGARVLVDGAQSVSHMKVDVQAQGCDFFVFSGHKVFAPTGIGVVYGKSEVLDQTPPWQGGGNMIQDVTFEKTLYQPPPQRFEAGTGNIADAVGLGAAIDYVERVGLPNISRHEHELLVYATEGLRRIPGLRIIGTAREKAGVLSFVIDGFRTEEIGDYLNRRGIAVRGGHHCAQPILRRFGVESTVRASLALYNTCEEVDALIAALWDLRQGRNTGLA